jgi:hypothetical protein
MTKLAVIAALIASSSLVMCQPIKKKNEAPEIRAFSSLPVAAQAQISNDIGQDSPDYSIRRTEDGGVGVNPAQKLELRFSSRGSEIRSGGRRVTLKANRFGYGAELALLPAVAPQLMRNRVEYRHGALAEWYTNGPVGLEQGFTVERAPRVPGQTFTIALEIGGDLRLVVDEQRTGLTLAGDSGRPELRYSGLSAIDADGKVLPAWLELRGPDLLLRVNDAGARYPVVVDPWVQRAELTSSDGVAGDEFGFSVAINGNTVVVGASQFNSTDVGAAYVFVKGSTGWSNMTQTAKLTASDGAAGAQFGSSVAFANASTIVVGAPHANVGANQGQGEAYVFVEPLSGWANMTETARLTSEDGAKFDDFGYSVSAAGNVVAVGAPQDSGAVSYQGAVYVFLKPSKGWTTTSKFKAKLTASNAQFDDGLGVSVSLKGTALVAGAANSGKGAAYVFVRPLTGWQTTSSFSAELTASDGQVGDGLGYSVSLGSNTVVAGAYLAAVGGNSAQGAVYVFVEPAGGWADMTETAKLTASDGKSGDEFGYSVSTSGNTIVAGASNDPGNDGAYVYVKPLSGWETTSTFKAKLTATDASIFGFSVATNGTNIVAGAIGNHSLQGAAYVFGH